jgi:hypothetical protein
MSLTQQQAQTLLQEAFVQVNKNIAPAKLADTHNNGIRLVGWVKQHRGTAPLTAKELAVAFENAARAITSDLDWSVLPAKLKNERLRNANIAKREKPLDREGLGKEVQARDQYEKLQKKSEEQINNLIDSFNPPHRRGGIDHGVKVRVQDALRKHLATEKARGVNLADVLPKLQQFVEDKYREIERGIERL